ncbi:hypothetical protein Fmac_014051 [Flemingia macrophylla]|uniref:Uncharacterized protein n=1 Tax=Flemingia macrophylla TaxID=520843 RepID=A0ABD1MBD8_9FABA
MTIEGRRIEKVLVDGGATINLLPRTMLKFLGKTEKDLRPHNIVISDYAGNNNEGSNGMLLLDVQIGSTRRLTMFVVVDSKANFNVLLRREWIHGVRVVPSTLHQKLFFWNDDGKIEVVETDYKKGQFGFETMEHLTQRMEAQDPLEEVNLGTEEDRRVTYVSKLLNDTLKEQIICTLRQYKDYFAWNYHEMPGLDRKIIEHRLPITPGNRTIKQSPRRFALNVMDKIKEEIERLLKAKFIRTSRYVEWLSNIVPVIKNNGKMRICINFRDLNAATPKDDYLCR